MCFSIELQDFLEMVGELICKGSGVVDFKKLENVVKGELVKWSNIVRLAGIFEFLADHRISLSIYLAVLYLRRNAFFSILRLLGLCRKVS